MERSQIIEALKREHAFLNAAVKQEESYVWKNIIKIEDLKKQKLRQKDQLMRMNHLYFKE